MSLVAAALENGALGAKMSGGGLGRLCHCSCGRKKSQAEVLAAVLERERGHLTHGSKACKYQVLCQYCKLSNIGGKKDAEKMIPFTSSISLTLENRYTKTQLSLLPDTATGDEFYIDGHCKVRQNMPKSVR